MASVQYNPQSTTQRMVRQQTFQVATHAGFRTLMGQIAILLKQLHDGKFTGSVTLDFNCGSIGTINCVDSQKVR